ncbi:hypothetical protein BH24BAC1_BH24BAC1_18610 [soil metagenome]
MKLIMKLIYKNKIGLCLVALLFSCSLSSCLKEKDPLFDVVGPVATFTVMTASKTNPAVGETITVSVRYYSPQVDVVELRLNETIGTGQKRQVTAKPITGFNTENSYVDTFQYTVPAGAARARITLEAMAIGSNELAGVRTVTLNIP